MNTKIMYQALELYRVISDLFDAEFMRNGKQIISVECKRLSALKDKTKARYQRRGGVQ